MTFRRKCVLEAAGTRAPGCKILPYHQLVRLVVLRQVGAILLQQPPKWQRMFLALPIPGGGVTDAATVRVSVTLSKAQANVEVHYFATYRWTDIIYCRVKVRKYKLLGSKTLRLFN
jgi:hypothetical protein